MTFDFPPSNLVGIDKWSMQSQGALVVVLEMGLAVGSILVNIMVISAIKHKVELMSQTFYLLLLNLCCSNLLSCVFVKSISIVHHGYAVAAHTITTEGVAFCPLYSLSSRLTWPVLPWTITCLAWITIIRRVKRQAS